MGKNRENILKTLHTSLSCYNEVKEVKEVKGKKEKEKRKREKEKGRSGPKESPSNVVTNPSKRSVNAEIKERLYNQISTFPTSTNKMTSQPQHILLYTFYVMEKM